MIKAEVRKTIYELHKKGMSAREISERLEISRNTVAAILEQHGTMPSITRTVKHSIDPTHLETLYKECKGFATRVHEKLEEEEGIHIPYSSLTEMLRKLGISNSLKQKKRCGREPDKPGEEMQHDTSPYCIKIGNEKVKIIASLLYLRYSKRRYLQFYRSFIRFKMKCFFHEALMYWGYAAQKCIIDNTNLARLRGTGKHAVIAAEMEAFSKQYGFKFVCHEIGHANRKAGEERGFYTIETNFFPGREFSSLEDLNRQAHEWSTVRYDNKPQTKLKLIPAKVFEFEQDYLIPLPSYLPEPYREHERLIDQYGYIPFNANHYWVPGTGFGSVKVLEYSKRIEMYQNRKCVVTYSLPHDGIKNEWFCPKDGSKSPQKQRSQKRKSPQHEEKRLRDLKTSVSHFLDFALKEKPACIGQFGYIRKLFAISQKMTSELFIKSIERAHKYKITNLHTIQNIAVLMMKEDSETGIEVHVDGSFCERESYLTGYLTDTPDLSIYNHLYEEDDDE